MVYVSCRRQGGSKDSSCDHWRRDLHKRAYSVTGKGFDLWKPTDLDFLKKFPFKYFNVMNTA